MNWQNVVDLVAQYKSGVLIEKFRRSDEIEASYQEHKNSSHFQLSELLTRVFPTEDTQIIFTANEFPYDFTADIFHGLIWCRESIGNLDNLFNLLSLSYELIWFENPDIWKTIPEVRHVHVFIHTTQDRKSVTDQINDQISTLKP